MVFSHRFFAANAPDDLHRIRRGVFGLRTASAPEKVPAQDGSASLSSSAYAQPSSRQVTNNLPAWMEELTKSEQALGAVEARFRQHEYQTSETLLAVGKALTERLPDLKDVINNVINAAPFVRQTPFPSTADESSRGMPEPQHVTAQRTPEDASQIANEPDASVAPTKPQYRRPTIQQLTAAVEDARESDELSDKSCGDGSEDCCSHRSSQQSCSRERSGAPEKQSGSDGDRPASDDRSGSEEGEGEADVEGGAEGSDERSDSSGHSSGKSAGRASDTSRTSDKSQQSGSAAGSSIFKGGSSASGGSGSCGVSSSSAEPHSEPSDHSRSDGAPTSISISSGE